MCRFVPMSTHVQKLIEAKEECFYYCSLFKNYFDVLNTEKSFSSQCKPQYILRYVIFNNLYCQIFHEAHIPIFEFAFNVLKLYVSCSRMIYTNIHVINN